MPSPRAACGWLAVLAFALFWTPAQAQVQTDTGTARAQAAILDRGSVANVADMDFGQIAQSSNPGTIVLAPQANPPCTVTGGLIRTGVCRAARFSVYGKKNGRFRIRQNTGGQVTLNGPGGATMSLTNITFAASGMTSVNGANGWNLGNWRIDNNSGIGEFYLGGTLNVNAAQAPGVYNGVIVIDVQLN
jgi:hypothetical protein